MRGYVTENTNSSLFPRVVHLAYLATWNNKQHVLNVTWRETACSRDWLHLKMAIPMHLHLWDLQLVNKLQLVIPNSNKPQAGGKLEWSPSQDLTGQNLCVDVLDSITYLLSSKFYSVCQAETRHSQSFCFSIGLNTLLTYTGARAVPEFSSTQFSLTLTAICCFNEQDKSHAIASKVFNDMTHTSPPPDTS